MKNYIKKIFLSIGFLGILTFYIWSKLFLVSIILFLILESFTTKVLINRLKKRVTKTSFKITTHLFLVLFPVAFAVFFRTFFFDVYFVPSSSMERTLFPKDYVVINKFSYGVKLPKHLRNVPVIGNFFSSPSEEYDLYKSLPSFKKISREDIVVFNSVNDIDKFLIKRIIGMPGETVQIEKGTVLINGNRILEKGTYTYDYKYEKKEEVIVYENYSNNEFSKLSSLKKDKYHKDIKEKSMFDYFLYPSSKQEVWNRDNYGDLVIPSKGMIIELTKENINIYKRIITKFENFDLSSSKEQFFTFKNNYYFMLGDNRHHSIDSRSFGFVPESYIQGKMVGVFSVKRLFN